MRPGSASAVFAVLAFAWTATAAAETLVVGPGERFAKPSQAARAAKAGDTVLIRKGVYVDVATWDAERLTIRGEEGSEKTVIRFDESIGRIAGGKGLWVVNARDCTIEGVGFEGAKCPDNNAAGLWIGAPTGTTTVVRCRFTRNQNGILTSARPDAEIRLDGCVFRENGFGDGYTHNIYVGRIRKLTCVRIVSDHCNRGHLLKSRAEATEIVDSVFDDGDDGVSSYLVDCPNGGKVRLVGCRLVQSPKATNGKMVAIGEEGAYPDTDFVNERNVFEDRRGSGSEVVLKK